MVDGRALQAGTCYDLGQKFGEAIEETFSWDDLGLQVGQRLDVFQKLLFDRALAHRDAKAKSVDT